MPHAPQQQVTYDLNLARRFPSHRVAARHQQAALDKLGRWFDSPEQPKGGILVLPTGGGKTFTAVRSLTTTPLSRGHKVLWLAHTHHLLDQAYHAFGQANFTGGHEVGHIRPPREQLTIRTVSGTIGHGRVRDITASDDVVIITVQTLARALQDGRHAGLKAFLKAARGCGLTVVFDECHHAPATSYRKLIETLRTKVPELQLLGLTATPTYTDVRRQGWLLRLFPQEVLHQVSAHELMLQGILSRPIIEEPRQTGIEPEFDEATFRAWSGSFRDLPEKVVQQLAQSERRNRLIAETYVQNREKYGQTIIFADRWYQCTALVELLRARGVRADAIFSHQDADPGSAEARNARSADENAEVLERFRRRELDVLVNIRMLTEGTDVPNVQTVFLTRQTTSRILLTQMIGRALRGPKFGGTAEAYIVAFIDQWKQQVNWARWEDVLSDMAAEAVAAPREGLPVELISIGLVEALARALDQGQTELGPALSLLPVGWYAVNFDAATRPAASEDGEPEQAADDVETVRQLVMVFDQDHASYERLFREHDPASLPDFEDITLSPAARHHLQQLLGRYFAVGERPTRLEQDLEAVLRHAAQNGAWPALTPFEARADHDMDALVNDLAFRQGLTAPELAKRLPQVYAEPARLWKLLYPTYGHFARHFSASFTQALTAGIQEDIPEAAVVSEVPQEEEMPEAAKRQVLRRDGRCLCCHSTQAAQVDHIRPRYIGGSHDLENLQRLCSTCNRLKGTAEMDFRQQRTSLTGPNKLAKVPVFRGNHSDAEALQRYVRRVVNLTYGCDAVKNVTIGQRGPRARSWTVFLHSGNPGRWAMVPLEQARQHLNAQLEQLKLPRIEEIRVEAE